MPALILHAGMVRVPPHVAAPGSGWPRWRAQHGASRRVPRTFTVAHNLCQPMVGTQSSPPAPADFLQLAREHLETAEALLRQERWRSSLDRAYYAMVAGARAMLLTRGIESRTPGGTLREPGRHFVVPGLLPRELGRALHQAARLRVKSDFGPPSLQVKKEVAVEVVGHARGFVEAAASHSAG